MSAVSLISFFSPLDHNPARLFGLCPPVFEARIKIARNIDPSACGVKKCFLAISLSLSISLSLACQRKGKVPVLCKMKHWLAAPKLRTRPHANLSSAGPAPSRKIVHCFPWLAEIAL